MFRDEEGKIVKKRVLLGISVAVVALAAMAAAAQVAGRSVTIGWDLPTVSTDGSPLTGTQAITKMQVFLNTVPIQDNASMLPTVELTGTPLVTQQTFVVPAGGTLYARVKACNVTGCSAFSAQVTKTFLATVPGIPTNVTITIVAP